MNDLGFEADGYMLLSRTLTDLIAIDALMNNRETREDVKRGARKGSGSTSPCIIHRACTHGESHSSDRLWHSQHKS